MNGPDNAPAAGLEACEFDSVAGFMYLNNDGSSANGHGEMDAIPIADLIAMRTTPLTGNKMVVFQGTTVGPLTPTGIDAAGFVQFNSNAQAAAQCVLGAGGSCGGVLPKVWALPKNCDPTGLALGAGTDIGAMCRSGEFGTRLDFVILNRTAVTDPTPGTPSNIVATVAGAGGGDQVAYDSVSNKYYLANSRATPNGKSCFQGGNQACNLTPKLGVVDGTTHAFIGSVDSGNNAHSVAAGNGVVVMPFAATSATAGGAAFPNGGIAIYHTF
jgi:hypothetical protein